MVRFEQVAGQAADDRVALRPREGLAVPIARDRPLRHLSHAHEDVRFKPAPRPLAVVDQVRGVVGLAEGSDSGGLVLDRRHDGVRPRRVRDQTRDTEGLKRSVVLVDTSKVDPEAKVGTRSGEAG